MKTENYLHIMAFVLTIIVIGTGIVLVKIKFTPDEEVKQTSCSCVTECLQDYEEYNTTNYFTMARHQRFNFETRDCEKVSQNIKENCCWGWK